MNCDRIKSRLVPFSHHFVVRGQDRITPPFRRGIKTHFLHLHLLYHLQIYYIFLLFTKANKY